MLGTLPGGLPGRKYFNKNVFLVLCCCHSLLLSFFLCLPITETQPELTLWEATFCARLGLAVDDCKDLCMRCYNKTILPYFSLKFVLCFWKERTGSKILPEVHVPLWDSRETTCKKKKLRWKTICLEFQLNYGSLPSYSNSHSNAYSSQWPTTWTRCSCSKGEPSVLITG